MTDRFDEFWEEYPRLDTTPRIGGKKKARELLLKAIRDEETTWEEVLSSVRLYAQCDKVTGRSSPTGIKYICMPKTWIGQARWEDEYEAAPVPFAQKAPSDYTEDDWRKTFGDKNGRYSQKLYSEEQWNTASFGPRPPHPDSIVLIEIQDEYRKWWPDLRIANM